MSNKIIPIISILFLAINLLIGQNEIDNLDNNKDVELFLAENFDNYSEFKLMDYKQIDSENCYDCQDCSRIADSLNVHSNFYKSDFDQNGLTDILIIGNFYGLKIIVVLDKKDHLEIEQLTRGYFQSCAIPILTSIDDKPIIKYIYSEIVRENGERNKVYQNILLTYKFNAFIEFNQYPNQENIRKIEYETTSCYGECPIFELRIKKNRVATFVAKNFNKRNESIMEGKYSAKINQENFNQLCSLINYINFNNLKDEYRVNWTDDQTGIIKVFYSSGKVKKVSDYGLLGSYGLQKMHNILHQFRWNQSWIKK